MSAAATTRVAVLGLGRMGTAIAAAASARGQTVNLWDPVESARAGAVHRVRTLLAQVNAAPAADGDLRLAAGVPSAVQDADVVIEAAPEDVRVKQELFGSVEQANEGAVLCSNTSVIPISLLATGMARPERLVGTHFWNPAHLVPVVEVIPGDASSSESVQRGMTWLTDIGKEPVLLRRDVPGFIGNRIQAAMWREALSMLEEGICDAETLDHVVRRTIGLRLAAVGPCENMAMIGPDLVASILRYLLPDLSRSTHPPAWLTDRGENLAGAAGQMLGAADGDDPPDVRLTQHLLRTVPR